jgi:hypothetical protein
MKKYIISIYILTIAISCNEQFNARDNKLKIFNNIINSEIFIQDHFGKTDSIYILKYSKKDSFKLSSKIFKIGYLQSNKDSTIIDFSPTSFNDKRTRLSFSNIDLRGENADIYLIVYRGPDHYEYNYNMKFMNDKWKIIKETHKAFIQESED